MNSNSARRLRHALSHLLLGALAATVVIAGSGVAQATPAVAGVPARIPAILAHRGVAGPKTGILVWDFTAGRTVYARNGATPLIPASTTKLVTAATALVYWGPEHRFTTELWIPDLPVRKHVLYGDIYLKGYGDPSLSTRDYQREELELSSASFGRMIRSLKKLRVRRIEGAVLGDDSWFDRQRSCAVWEPRLKTECGSLGALTGNESLSNGTPVRNPAQHTASLFTASLKASGIKVFGKPGGGRVPADYRLAMSESSTPLRLLLRRLNKDSDNFFAEMFVKGFGKDFYGAGSTATGAQLSGLYLSGLDIAPDEYALLDGSGLSYRNRLTAEDLVKVLGAMRVRRDHAPFADSLAVAGRDGTLADRMKGTVAAGNVRAKTGTLKVASCLAGYVTTRNRHEVGFAILMNGESLDLWQAMQAQDEIAVALAGARLPGRRVLLPAQLLRQRAVSAVGSVHLSRRVLEPVVDP